MVTIYLELLLSCFLSSGSIHLSGILNYFAIYAEFVLRYTYTRPKFSEPREENSESVFLSIFLSYDFHTLLNLSEARRISMSRPEVRNEIQ